MMHILDTTYPPHLLNHSKRLSHGMSLCSIATYPIHMTPPFNIIFLLTPTKITSAHWTTLIGINVPQHQTFMSYDLVSLPTDTTILEHRLIVFYRNITHKITVSLNLQGFTYPVSSNTREIHTTMV